MNNEQNTYSQIERLLTSGNEPCKKRELDGDLTRLLAQLPEKSPLPGGPDYENYQQIQKKINALKQKMIEKHNNLMEALRAEENFCREVLSEKNLL
jgi:hypothetical protein